MQLISAYWSCIDLNHASYTRTTVNGKLELQSDKFTSERC